MKHQQLGEARQSGIGASFNHPGRLTAASQLVFPVIPPDIISQFESLQVSDKLAAPLQPQRVVPVPVPRLLDVPKRATASDASIQAARAKEATKKPQTLNDSIFAGPVGPVTSNANVIEPNVVRPQTTNRGLSANLNQDFIVLIAAVLNGLINLPP
ncbi:hypothetical protein PENFLA_c041G07865 [Penicillium flavigenum]|uniref:Uncharacterized protein n=1 Tax=Penicillium flavigenum TaxID=254877 RepID=A0A1V6SJ03_9EURO|nr:hypothetical protein PENFLA_c041G07865 [Penicillium flavigenum]